MDVNDTARRFLQRYWLLLLLATAIPLGAVAVLVPRQADTYTANARLLAAPVAPRSPAESAALASQVGALATSRELIERSLADAKVSRDPEDVAQATSATGLGSSALVNLAYTDRNPKAAQQVAAALAATVVRQLDASRFGRLPNAITDLDGQVKDLAARRDKQADDAAGRPLDRVAQNRLANTERQLAELLSTRTQLAADLAALGNSTVVAAPSLPTGPDSQGLAAKLALAGLLGLALGLIFMGANEALRPRLGGAAGAGRVLGVPVLGSAAAKADPSELADTGRRIRLAAGRARVSTVVVAGANGAAPPAGLVERIEDAVLNTYPAARLVPVGTDGDSVDGRRIDEGKIDGDGTEQNRLERGRGTQLLGEVDDPVQRQGVAVLTRMYNATTQPGLRRVCGLDDIDSDNEAEHRGLVVVANRLVAAHDLRKLQDLLATAGWPLLGVVAEDHGRGTR